MNDGNSDRVHGLSRVHAKPRVSCLRSLGIWTGCMGGLAVACVPVNDLNQYATPSSGGVHGVDAGSAASVPGSSSRGPNSGGRAAFDEGTPTPEDELSNTMPGSTPGEGIQQVPLDAPVADDPIAAGDVDAGSGKDPIPQREPVSAPISSAIPADGALGVSPDVVLVIDFGRAMDPSTLPRALVSDDLALADASFAWNADNSVVRITLAQPLAVASGTDPAQVVARCFSYRVSDAAIDADGNALLPSDITFCTARRITQTLQASADPDLSGSFRSDDGFGDGACSRGANTVCVGDSGFAANSSYRGFLTFDASALPQSMLVVEAELRMQTNPAAGTPFEDLGELVVEQTRFTRIGAGPFDDDDVTQLGVIKRAGDDDLTLLGDVPTLRAAENDRIQLRLRFEDGTDQDGRADHIVALVNAASLSVSYQIP